MKPTTRRKTDVVIVLLVFCVFVMSVLTVLSLSGTSYKNIISLTNKTQDEHIGLSFIWTKVKNNDEIGRIYLASIHDQPALCIESEFDGYTFYTMIYHYDGWLHEVFFEKGFTQKLESGFPLVRASTFQLEELEKGLLRITLDGETLLLSPRGGTTMFK